MTAMFDYDLFMALEPVAVSADRDARIAELAFIRRRAELDARETMLLASIAADSNTAPSQQRRGELDKQWLREDVACALRISPIAAASKLHTAAVLATRFPATVQAMHDGAFGLWHARRPADAAHGLPVDAAAWVEAAVLPRAASQTLTQFAVLPAAQAVVMRERVQQLADRWQRTDTRVGVVRTADQRRADALCALVLGTTDTDTVSVRPVVHATVALSTLLHLDDQAADVAGHGPVPAVLARALAADPNGTWRRLLSDGIGQVVDYGRRTYRPPARLAALVMARDMCCTFPGCARTARRCELDHLLAWNDRGTTSAGNLHPLCPRHHHLKHEARWDVEREPDGTTQWISPGGRVHRVPPPDRPVDRTRRLVADASGTAPPF